MSWPRVTKGDRLRIPAGAYNALLDSLGRELGGNPRNEGSETPVEVSVRNDTGSGLDDSSIVAIGQPVITPTENLPTFKSRHVFSGGTPSANSVIGVLVNPLPDSSIGRAVVGGLAKVKVNVTDSSHGYANSTTSTLQLTSGANGPHRIVWKESGSGSKWAIVCLNDGSRGTDTRMTRLVEPTEMHPTLPATYKAYVLRWNPTTNQLENDFLVWLRMY